MSEDQHKTVIAPATVLAPADPAKVGDRNVAPTTTEAEDLITAGQRRINIVWELTQATIAILVTLITLSVCAVLIIRGDPGMGAFLLLSNVFFLIVGTYFQRTNHTKTGGVGKNESGR